MFRVKVNCSWFLDRAIPQELDGPVRVPGLDIEVGKQA